MKTSNGVPYVAVPPSTGADGAPLVVIWHMLDSPRTEVAMASALPLRDVPAWKVYLGLPMSGQRMPWGGPDEFMRLVAQDSVLNVFEPITTQAVAEFPETLAELRATLPVSDQLNLVGGSLGAMVALKVLADTDIEVRRVALVSPAAKLSTVVQAGGRMFGMTYVWSPVSREIASRLDFVSRADEIKQPLLMVIGENDDEEGFLRPAKEMAARLPAGSTLVTVPDMAHALSEEPGIEAAPQTPHAAAVDRIVTDWLTR